jgi:hypothetical protein
MQMKEISMENQTQLNVVDLAQYPKVTLQVGDLVQLTGWNGKKRLQSTEAYLLLELKQAFDPISEDNALFVVTRQLNNQYYVIYHNGVEKNCYRNFLSKIVLTV